MAILVDRYVPRLGKVIVLRRISDHGYITVTENPGVLTGGMSLRKKPVGRKSIVSSKLMSCGSLGRITSRTLLVT